MNFRKGERCLYRTNSGSIPSWKACVLIGPTAGFDSMYTVKDGDEYGVPAEDLLSIDDGVLRLSGPIGHVFADDCGLTRLDCDEARVSGTFSCQRNRITTLEGAPMNALDVNVLGNPLESVKGCQSAQTLTIDGGRADLRHVHSGIKRLLLTYKDGAAMAEARVLLPMITVDYLSLGVTKTEDNRLAHDARLYWKRNGSPNVFRFKLSVPPNWRKFARV